ncbi:hypothetical protein [Brumimicrobium aurantiacum]|nr:hypothetical protein [Brumimicrobium aurantiacum]
MKLTKTILTGLFATAMITTAYSGVLNESSFTIDYKTISQEQTKEEIALTSLPSAITDELKTDAYAGWKAKKAYVVKTKEGKHYEVLVSNGEEKMSLFFNEDGRAIEK